MKGLLQLKAYIYAKLSADVNLINLMNGVNIYDIVQEEAVLPYITYERIISNPAHQLDADVYAHNIVLSIVAKADSSLTTHNIVARIEQLFEGLIEVEDLNDGFRLLSVDVKKSTIGQVDFEFVKASLEFECLIEGGVGL